MKKIYSLCAVALASMTTALVPVPAFAEAYITSDTEIADPFGFSEWYNNEGVSIVGCTATIKYFSLNGCAFAPAYVRTSHFVPVRLMNGAAVKFYDAPNYLAPSQESFEALDEPAGIEWTWEDDLAAYMNPDSLIEYDWVIEGTGNAIYLDSYCEFGGTFTGTGDVTIYVSNKSKLSFTCGNINNLECSSFAGTIYIKSLDGYACDTINVTSKFGPGQLKPVANQTFTGVLPNKTYSASCTLFDITSFGGNVVWNQVGANSLVYPPIRGKGTIHTSNYPYFNGATDAAGEPISHEYDAVIDIEGSDSHDFEMYGNTIAYNAPINGTQKFFYVRSEAAVYFNSPEPSMSGFLQGLSQRGKGFTGGTGYADIDYTPSSGRANILSAGYPYDAVGQMTWRGIYMYNSNIVRFDFDNEGHADILNVADVYTMYEGQNEVQIGMPDNFQPKAGKYKVINGKIDAGLASYVDTVGYEVWDNNGPAYVIRSVKGGEIIALADGTNDNYVAQPGDSIGTANFSNLASTYGATIMDERRPHYVVYEWGPGSYSNGEPTDGTYKNTDSPSLYTPNPEQVGTAFSDPDSTKWEAIWQKFLDEHPVSNAWEAVTPDDPSVIPGTVTDSIFLTYSRYRTEEADGGIAGEHAWSYGNGSNYPVGAYPYAHPITYSYFYYSNNTVRVQTGRGSNYISEGGDTLQVVSFGQLTFPIALTANRDSVAHENITVVDGVEQKDTTWTFVTDTVGYRYYTAWSEAVPQANGDLLQYRFNFKNYITDGIIAIETQTTTPAGEVILELPAEEDSPVIVNEGDLTGIGTMLKETHAVDSREIFTLSGVRVNQVGSGIHVVRTVYTDGTVETKRVIIR